jgi:hypothetical protein
MKGHDGGSRAGATPIKTLLFLLLASSLPLLLIAFYLSIISSIIITAFATVNQSTVVC